LLGIGVCGADSQGEFVDVGVAETGGFELVGDGFGAAHSRQEGAPDPHHIEVESVEHSGCFEIAELNLELNPGLQQGGSIVGIAGAEGPRDEGEKFCQVKLAEQQRGPIDHSHHFLDRRSNEILGGRQMAENQ
jgi:hypothetical protein